MKIIFKITKHNSDEKVISVKICRLHSHIPIDDYKSKRVDYSGFDLSDKDTFIDSLVKKCNHRIQNQDEKENILKENLPNNIDDELDIDSLIGCVIQGKISGSHRSLLKMRRIYL
tara:strand:- start:94 stop:438 length:345 start_codon:yes stop_codon:yes gene_type:complete